MHFVTIVPHIENLELRKDTGQIPYHMGLQPGIRSTLVTYYYRLEGGRKEGAQLNAPDDMQRIKEDYPFLETATPGLQIHFLSYRGRGKFYERAIFKYIRTNARKIDVLNLFHYNAENIFYGICFKLLNPTGKLYLKLDIDIPYYERTKHFFNIGRYRFIKRFLFEKLLQPLFFQLVHTISAESQTGLQYFIRRFPAASKKMILLANGVDDRQISALITSGRTFAEKENLLITVGRIGNPQKNNEMLLSALEKTNLFDWKVCFIGGIEPSFEANIAAFFFKYPEKKDKVLFTGKINSPAELYDYYDRAKLFCLTSIDEGFPLSGVEAAYFGNYMILSDTIDCYSELTNQGKFGEQVPLNDVQALSRQLECLFTDQPFLEAKLVPMKTFARERLTWQSIIPTLEARFSD